MGTEAKQGQRFVVMDGKRFAVEQVQTVTVVQPEDLTSCMDMAYQICKAEELPAMPTVKAGLVDAALRVDTVKDAARCLGIHESDFYKAGRLGYERKRLLKSG